MRNVKALFVVLCAMFLAVVCHVPAYPDPIVCTDAYYEDNGECMPCPNRYDYNLDSGKTSISQCQVQCPAGTYVDQPDVSNIGAGYSRLEYLESTGSQYIDTGHKHGSTNIHGVIRVGTNVNITGNVNIMGNQSGNAASDSGYSVGWSPPANGKPGNLFKIWVQSSNNRLNGATPHYLNAGTIHDIEFGLTANKRWIKYDNQTFESTHAGRIVSNTNIHLFDNGVHQMNQNFKGLIYYIKIYEDEVLVHNYLPVRENAGQQRVGILDTITGEFYTNSSGTGAFNVGTDVTEPCAPVGAGYYAEASVVNQGDVGQKTPCPIGTYSDDPNATSLASCLACPADKYNEVTAATACKNCPSGYTANTDLGKTAQNQCKVRCVAGKYVASARGSCSNVGAGYWAAESLISYGSTGTRTACPAGTSATNGTSAASCTECTNATYSTGGTACLSCPTGYDYNTTSGKTSASQCQISCSGGTYVDTANATCTDAGAGYYAAASVTNYGSTGTRTACPAGTTTTITNASSASDCRAACNNDEIFEYVNGIASCIPAKFTVTTTNLNINENTEFKFNLSAKGTFYVDCGTDGTLSGTGAVDNTITRGNTTNALYTCTYTTGGVKTIKFAGVATAYSTSNTVAAISFYTNATPGLVGEISGSLGAMFPTLGSTNGLQPRFYNTFYNCTNMTGSIPSGLFTGISGAPATYMFGATFQNCSGLTGSIPSGLFGNLSGAPAKFMFSYTFRNCSGLTGSIPSGLFGNISGAPATQMFSGTFYNCSGLTGSIPSGLFGNLSGAPAADMFNATFSYCSGLTGSIPSGLFGNLSGAPASGMFNYTFGDCSGLTGSIPSGLFGNLSGALAGSMFSYTFGGCSSLTGSIPSGLFGNLSGAPKIDMFSSTFRGCSGLSGSIPSGLFGNISGAPEYGMFYATFMGCSSLTGSIPSGLFGNLSGAPETHMFNSTFNGCSGLTGSIPSGLFGNLSGAPAYEMFAGTFGGCSGLTGYIPKDIFENITGSGGISGIFTGTNLYTTCPCGTKPAATGWGDTTVNTRAVCEVGTKTNEHWDNGTCTTDCTLGVTRFKSSTGLDYPLLSDPTGVHNIYFGYNNGVCHVPLVAGAANNAINVSFNGGTYHASHPDEIVPVGFTGQPAPAISGN